MIFKTKYVWNIDKQFDFCYGHRVHNQKLDVEYSLDSCLVCRHLHGHQGKIKIHLECNVTPEKVAKGMVTDFKNLNFFKKWLDDTLDHKFIFDINDPLLFVDELSFIAKHTEEYKFEEVWTPHYLKNPKELDKLHPEVYYTINFDLLNRILDDEIKNNNLNQEQAQAIFEKYEGIVIVDFIPTSENLSTWLLKILQVKMEKLMNKEDFKIHSVEFWETPKSHCQVFVN